LECEFVRLIPSLHVLPFDLPVCVQSTRLDFRGDSADEIIAATNIVHKMSLLTRDRKI
jgi:PIN domain nuclease of toxin-antitoxin system